MVQTDMMQKEKVIAFIENLIQNNSVVLFIKGTQERPECGFSAQVIQILKYLKVPFVTANVFEHGDMRAILKEYSNWPTFPQLYVKGQLIGGCDITRSMFEAGELQELLKDI